MNLDVVNRSAIVVIILAVTFVCGIMIGAAVAAKAAHNAGYNECLMNHVVKDSVK